MKKYYFIKKHYEATESNENFAGEVKDFYCGKGMTSCSEFFKYFNYYIKNNAYTRLCDAKRAYKAHLELANSEMKYGFWKVSVEIVEFEVA